MKKITRRGFLAGSLATTAATQLSSAQAAAPSAPAEQLSFTLNGEPVKATVGEDESTLEFVRARGLTAAKLACGHGACGACTVLLNDQPVCSCLLPATSMHGASIRTLEGYGPELHPIQRAFLAEDALQCGFCTPGFVLESIHFYTRWRAEFGVTVPSRAQVAEALSGHLCRCGSYAAIYRAVRRALAGDFDEPLREYPRTDGRKKVLGVAKYTVDISLPGLQIGHIRRSSIAHGVVKRIDISPAQALQGVSAVIALVKPGQKIRYFGQELVAVAADSVGIAERALQHVILELEPAVAVLGFDDALVPGAPEVFTKQERRGAGSAAEGGSLPAPWRSGNLRGPLRSHLFGHPGQADARIAQAANVFRQTYETQTVAHTTLEPHAAVARADAEQIEVWVSTQSVDAVAADLAERFDRPRVGVQVHAQAVGGGFGCKAGLQIETLIAVKLSIAAGAPVKVVLSRAEEIAVGGTRPAERIQLEIATNDSGELVGLRSQAWGNSGAAVGSLTGILLRMMYPCSAKRLEDYDVLTHTSPARPFRAPGGPQVAFAMEGAIDAIAAQRGESPLTVRRRWDPNEVRNHLYGWAEEHPIWGRRQSNDTGRYRRGVGLAAATWFYFVDVNTQVQVEVRDGRVTARTASQDMGNGTASVLQWSLAEALGLPRTLVDVQIGNSDYVHGPLSAGSRTAASVVPAVEHAAEQIREILVDVAADTLHIEGRVGPHGITHADGFLSWLDLLPRCPRSTVVGRRRRDQRAYFLPFTIADLRIGRQSPGAVQLTEVEVDMRLGRTRVVDVAIGIGVGRIFAPPIARSQVEGGVIQAISYALFEDRRLDPTTGVLLSHNLEDYRIAGLGDIPPIDIHFEERGFSDVRGGGVGLAELCTSPGAASIANAVGEATGVRPVRLPIQIGASV